MAIYSLQRKGIDATVGLKRTNTVTDSNEIPNLAQVQAIAEGLAVTKEAVAVCTEANIDLATGGLLTIDSYTLSAGERVLVKSQTDATENGIYDVASGSWTRSVDADTQAELKPATTVRVLYGDDAGLVFQLTNSTNPVPDTDSQTWAVIGASSDKAADVDVVDTSFTQLTGTDAQTLFDDIDDKLQDIHDEVKRFTSTTLTSGSGITFNHALNQQFLRGYKVYEDSSPFEDITANVTVRMTDANNITITNDGADVDVIVVCEK